MAFKVRFTGQGQPQDYGDDDGFEFLEGGVLAIHFGDEKWDEYHPPAKWDHVTADPDHLAGLNTPYVDEDEDDCDETKNSTTRNTRPTRTRERAVV